ncbi:hypothetical protein DVH24_037847 [Malus domestica]|uniref:Uncharacterized protein n=1 Tax=Malus domestica TaxID=3750 RepID=A0A498JWL9_MALDO|nr:hypothetical protein DVH24_037847 [Malus domestica]
MVPDMTTQGVQLATKEEEVYKEGLTTYPKPPMKLVHELFHRVANQGVKDLEGLTYLIGCELTQFAKQDFYLITRLRCDEPHDIELEP